MRDDASQDDMLADEGEDPVIEACLRDALAPYMKALSPEQLLDYRRYLTVFIKTHPSAAPLYERLRGRVALDASAAVPKEGDGDDEDGALVWPEGTWGERG
ncbi:hypothetical protein [Sorangium sp. So ce1000]|uniref:hypothetical protein n=1 Tax=Sorangium sp. So ce1000 TaxID=3133325 RepID=UPI003F5E0B24